MMMMGEFHVAGSASGSCLDSLGYFNRAIAHVISNMCVLSIMTWWVTVSAVKKGLLAQYVHFATVVFYHNILWKNTMKYCTESCRNEMLVPAFYCAILLSNKILMWYYTKKSAKISKYCLHIKLLSLIHYWLLYFSHMLFIALYVYFNSTMNVALFELFLFFYNVV